MFEVQRQHDKGSPVFSYIIKSHENIFENNPSDIRIIEDALYEYATLLRENGENEKAERTDFLALEVFKTIKDY